MLAIAGSNYCFDTKTKMFTNDGITEKVIKDIKHLNVKRQIYLLTRVFCRFKLYNKISSLQLHLFHFKKIEELEANVRKHIQYVSQYLINWCNVQP